MPPQAQWTIEIQPSQETLVGKVRPMLLVLLGAAILMIFMSFSLNIPNLLVGARFSGRQQEMAVRLALGASRSMVRQMLTEPMLLSLIGGVAGTSRVTVSTSMAFRTSTLRPIKTRASD